MKDMKEPFFKIAALLIALMFIILVFTTIKRSFSGDIEPEKYIYFEIILLLLLAVLAEAAVFYFKQQSVVILMILGIIISPNFIESSWVFLRDTHFLPGMAEHAPELFRHEEIINIFAQLGAIILLFKVGLHSKVDKIFSKTNFLVGISGIIIPFALGYLYAYLTQGNFAFSMFLGAALAATSVGVTVAILKDLNVLDKDYSEVIIGAAIIDDILALLLLSVVVNLVEAQGNAFASVMMTFITAVVFILGAIITGRFVIKYIDRREMGQKRLLISIAFMLLFAYIAEVIKLSAIVGAFLAGVILNQSRNYKIIEERTYGLELLFMPIFFISLGLLVDITAIFQFFIPILILTAIAFVSKVIGCGIAAKTKLNTEESKIVGVGMAPRGEVALIIASIGLTKGVLPVSDYSIISAMALLTSFIVPPILSNMIKKSEKAT